MQPRRRSDASQVPEQDLEDHFEDLPAYVLMHGELVPRDTVIRSSPE